MMLLTMCTCCHFLGKLCNTRNTYSCDQSPWESKESKRKTNVKIKVQELYMHKHEIIPSIYMMS